MAGGSVWAMSCLLGWPIALGYKRPEILWLFPAIGLSAVIGGIASTNMVVASRNLGIVKVTLIDILSSLTGLFTMIFFAWLTRSVWALVVGSLTGALLKTVASHVWLEGNRNYFI